MCVRKLLKLVHVNIKLYYVIKCRFIFSSKLPCVWDYILKRSQINICHIRFAGSSAEVVPETKTQESIGVEPHKSIFWVCNQPCQTCFDSQFPEMRGEGSTQISVIFYMCWSIFKRCYFVTIMSLWVKMKLFLDVWIFWNIDSVLLNR